MKTFSNPYVKVPKDQQRQIIFRSSDADYSLIKCMRPSLGTLAITAGTLFHELCNELTKRNITDYSKVLDFEQFIAGCHIVSEADYNYLRTFKEGSGSGLPHGTSSGPLLQTSPLNDRRGVEEPGNGKPSDATVLPGIQIGSGSKRKSRKSKENSESETKTHEGI